LSLVLLEARETRKIREAREAREVREARGERGGMGCGGSVELKLSNRVLLEQNVELKARNEELAEQLVTFCTLNLLYFNPPPTLFLPRKHSSALFRPPNFLQPS
jgi:hypothetical protein